MSNYIKVLVYVFSIWYECPYLWKYKLGIGKVTNGVNFVCENPHTTRYTSAALTKNVFIGRFVISEFSCRHNLRAKATLSKLAGYSGHFLQMIFKIMRAFWFQTPYCYTDIRGCWNSMCEKTSKFTPLCSRYKALCPIHSLNWRFLARLYYCQMQRYKRNYVHLNYLTSLFCAPGYCIALSGKYQAVWKCRPFWLQIYF